VGSAPSLAERVRSELEAPVSDAAARLAEELRRRHGDALRAVLFYGSCLRRRSDEGVLDFYAVVESYGAAYRSRALAWANAALPPNVFYLETEGPDGTVRGKVAILSQDDFARGTGPKSRRPGTWARFCQPVALAFARDAESRRFVAQHVAEAVRTAVRRILPLLPERNGESEVAPAEFWPRAFRETYSMEMRTESEATIRSLYEADRERYDAALAAALRDLARAGEISVREDAGGFHVRMDPARRRRARRRWRLRRPVVKLVYLVGLGKSAFTFGDWLPYVRWKVERHTGRPVEMSERQRRHPLLFGWPVLFRLLWERRLR